MRTPRSSVVPTVRLGALALAAGLALSACGSDAGGADAAAEGPLRVAATAVPHADLLRFVDTELAADAGLDLEVVEFDDYAIGNRWLAEGEVDANYFQHQPYLDAQESDFDYELTAFGGVHIEPYAAFSETVADVADLPDRALVGITDDASNQARALDLLAEADLIELPDVEGDITVYDIEDNPKDLQFVETDPAQLPRSLADFDLAILNGNYFLEAGLSVTDALLVEDGDSPYANFLTSRDDNADDERIVLLDELLRSEEVRAYIEQTWPEGDVVAAF